MMADDVLAESSGRRTRSGRTATTALAIGTKSRRKRPEEEKSNDKDNGHKRKRDDQHDTNFGMNILPKREEQDELQSDERNYGEVSRQPFPFDDEVEMIALPSDVANIDDKSSSFPFGTADNSEASDEPKEIADRNAVDSSLLASLAGDNANSLPSVGGGDEPDGKNTAFSSNAVDDNGLSDESITQPAIAEDLPGDGDISNATIVNNEIISEEELRPITKQRVAESEVFNVELPSGVKADTNANSEEDSPDSTNVSDVKKSSNSNLRAKRKSEDTYSAEKTSRKGHKKRKNDEQYNPMSPTSESNDSSIIEKKLKYEDCEHKDRRREKERDDDKDRERDKEREREKDKDRERRKLPDLERYWRAVKQDPTDFTGWTYLLQYVDNENDADAAREAYDTFLAQYPYCYGYWRKYADYEKRKGIKANCNAVFERGLKAIPLSVDLWIHYIGHVKTIHNNDDEYIRTQFDAAIEACGLEFRSDKLWDAYINFENEAERYHRTLKIYDRLLAIPTQGYAGHFEGFQELITKQPITSTISAEELYEIRHNLHNRKSRSKHTIKSTKNHDRDEKQRDESSQDSFGGKSPRNRHDAHNDDEISTNDLTEYAGANSSAELDDPETMSEDEIELIKERVISLRRKVHKETLTAVSERWAFEEGIKRPYFHVKPLERAQINNWRVYLDFEIEKGDRQRILVLFERCLIACALYDEFWLKMIRYLETISEESSDIINIIRSVYQRACEIHHQDKPSLHLMWSAYEECQNNFNKAAEILVNIEKRCPNLLQVSYRRINIERRRGDLIKCRQFYKHYIETAKSKAIAASLSIKYARFLNKICNDIESGLRVLRDALERDPNNTRVALQMIDLAVQRPVVDETEVVAIMDKFMKRESIDPEERVLFAQRKVEFLEDFGSTAKGLQDAQRALQTSLAKAKETKERRETQHASQKTTDNVPAQPETSEAESYSNNNTDVTASVATDGTSNYNYGSANSTNYYGQGNNNSAYSPSYDVYYNQWQYGSGGSGYNYGQWSGYGNYYQ